MGSELETIEDLDAAIERVHRAPDDDAVQIRRALREALACLYELREYRAGASRAQRQAYYARAESDPKGRVTEGVMFVRAKESHALGYDSQPEERGLYPGADTFPGEHTYPGSNLVWLAADELHNPPPADPRDKETRAAYESHVAGQPVLESLHAARDFLADDSGPAA